MPRSAQRKPEKIRLLQELISAGLRVFTTKDVKKIASELGIDPSYTLIVISSLIQDGWMAPIKKGVYYFTSVTGISPIHEYEMAMYLVKPAMIGYYSAFYQHGITDQVPRIVYISTLKETATPQQGQLAKKSGFRLNGIDYQIVQLKKDKFYGGIQAWRGESRFIVGDLERTLLEGFASPHYCGGFSEVMYGLEQCLQRLDLDKLIQYAKRWDIATGRRIGWALEQFNIINEQTLSLAALAHPGYRRLDPSQAGKGSYSNRWRLQINI